MYGVDDPLFGLRFARASVSFVVIFKASANCIVRMLLNYVKFSTIFQSLAVAGARMEIVSNISCLNALFALF